MGSVPIRLWQRTRGARGRAGARRVASVAPDPRSPGTLLAFAPLEPVASAPPRADTIVDVYQAEHLALFRFARAATGDDEAAEDVLQEAFVRLIREVAAGRPPANAHAWLFRVATNLVVSQARRARTAERHLADLGGERLVESPESHVLLTERDEALRSALTALPVDGRVALLLAAQGFSGREIAGTLGRSEGAARTLLCRTRAKIRERLETDDPPRERARRPVGA